MKKFWFTAILAASVASAASAQVSSINSVQTLSRVYNDDSTSNLTYTNNYPSSIFISDQNVSTASPGSFANRDVWKFSNNSGASAYQFNNDDFFTTSMTLTLTASGTNSPRKEAGYLFDTAGGQGQFILDSDAHEIAAFGGPLPFYAFPSVFQSGDTVTMGMTYFLDSSGKRAIIYTANDLTQSTGLMTSPVKEFTNLEQGLITGSTLGGYEQVQINTANPANGITANFANIQISATPEPSGFAALGVGVLSLGSLVLRKRKAGC